jgi:DNA-binding CsgD family transcriptional regulator
MTTRRFSERGTQRLNTQSLRALVKALPAIYEETNLARLPAVFAKTLAALFPGEAHGIVVREFIHQQRHWYLQPATSERAAPAPELLSSFRECVPPNPFQLTAPNASLALVNIVTRSSLHPLEHYRDSHHLLGTENDFDVELRHREAVICAAVLRHHGDFSPQECALMNALRPHLQQAWRNAEAFEDLKARVAASGITMPQWNSALLETRCGLTPREAEVLIWVAQGKTNGDAAAILGITPNTVRTHLERVFAKLGVETRHAASLCALEVLGLHSENHAPQSRAPFATPLAACA